MAHAPEHSRVHTSPRITANELARFMVSGDTGRIGIIRRSRISGTAQRTRYKDAKIALRAAMADAVGERRILAEARNMFDQRAEDSSLSDFRRDDAAKSLDVLTSFAEMRNQLAGYDYVPAPGRQPSLTMGGVEVSVVLDLLIHRSNGASEEIGGLLFRLTQSDEEETEAAATKRRDMGLYASTLVHMQVSTNLAGNRKPAHPLCWSVDVQCREVHVAPRTYAKRAQDIENACRFIAAMWDRV